MPVRPSIDQRLASVILVAVPIALAIVVYRDFINVYFWTDDFLWLATPANLDTGSVFREAFAFPRGVSPYWRPLVDIYFFGMYKTFELDATAYHIGTLGLHTTSAVILGFLALRLTRSLRVAALAAGLYVISPTYSSMIPWTSGVTGALSGFCAVVMAYFFLSWLEEQRPRWLILSMIGLAGALLAKEDASALPVVLVIMALAMKQPQSVRELKSAALLVLPLVGVWLVYLIPQFAAVVWSDEASQFSIGWHAVPRLGIAMSWLSLPYPLWFAGWVEVSRWIALGFFTGIAFVAALRRAWLLPALYLSAVVLLLPSSFLTSGFAPRWTYHASLPWAIFVAVTFIRAFQRLDELNAPIALGAQIVAGFMLVILLSDRSIESQVWVPALARDYQRIERAIAVGCAELRVAGSVYVYPLPIGGPGFHEYAVPDLVRTVKPGAAVFVVGQQSDDPGAPGAPAGDCTITYSPTGEYAGTIVR